MNLLFYELIDLGLTEEAANEVMDKFGDSEERIQANIDFCLDEKCLGKVTSNFPGFLVAAIRNDYAKKGNTKWRPTGDWDKNTQRNV
jgi:hypothetical protein